VPRPKKPKPTPPNLSTPRTRRLRERRKHGLRLVNLPISEEAIDALVKLLWLQNDDRNNPNAIQNAVAQFLHASLVEKYQFTPWARAAREERQKQRAEPSPQPSQQ
jgi:hypothetical protein